MAHSGFIHEMRAAKIEWTPANVAHVEYMFMKISLFSFNGTDNNLKVYTQNHRVFGTSVSMMP